LRLQSELADRKVCDNRSWASEAALDAILDAAEAGTLLADQDCSRFLRTAARRERARAALRKRYISRDEPQVDPLPCLEARSELRLVHSRLAKDEDWRLLNAVAYGYRYNEVPAPSATAARVHVLRLRRKLAA
jgi:hypothetical protein